MELNIPKNDCFVFADHYTIAQMIANLLDNAIKYTKRGSVTIELLGTSTSYFAVRISDTGIGMSEEYQEKIFEPFTQEHQGYSRKYDGSGLGLSLVMKYAKLNDVDLTFKSKQTEGTSFKLVFPKNS